LLDIIIVAYLIFRVYKLLKGGLAFYIFLGITVLFIAWWIVTLLKMELLTMILGQFVSVGVIALVIIFQPEIRKFLLVLGNNAVKGNIPFFNGRFFRIMKAPLEESPMVAQLHSSMLRMAKERVGALIVLAEDLNFPGLEDSGILINAEVTKQLIVSIFNKESPLHDGAMVIYNMKIYKASCILPVSDNLTLPPHAGLRHRAGLGLSEVSNAHVFIVSEERGTIAHAYRGNLNMQLEEDQVLQYLRTAIKGEEKLSKNTVTHTPEL